ncbi:MAG: hypothetical protein H7A36_01850 [Chlamydiales bacterium]|nr:hypothetical protein [Chlamydiales bacterium]
MKKLYFLSILLAAPFAAFALPVNNPEIATLACDGVFFSSSRCATPIVRCDVFSVRLGYYGDFIFNNYTQVDQSGRKGSIQRTQLYTNAGEIDFNLWNRFEVFAVLGVADAKVSAPISNFSVGGAPVNSLLSIETTSDFAWSIGGRGTLFQCGRLGFGVEGQYFATNPEINCVRDHFNSISTYINDQELHYQSWQVGLGVTYEVIINGCFSFLPYGALAWAGTNIDMGNRQVLLSGQNVTAELFNLKKERPFGYALGATLLGGERVLITAEGRFAYEKALFLSVQMRL